MKNCVHGIYVVFMPDSTKCIISIIVKHNNHDYHSNVVNCPSLDYYCVIGLHAHRKYAANLSIIIVDFAHPNATQWITINLNLVDIILNVIPNALNYCMARIFDMQFNLIV